MASTPDLAMNGCATPSARPIASITSQNPGAGYLRRSILLAGLSFTLLTGFFWPRFFDLQWDEEVQLHDGRVIVARVKYTYERRSGLTLNRFDPSLFREATLTFDAGPSRGVVTQRFIHQRPMLLDTEGGDWFVVLQGRAGSEVQNWGPPQNGNGQRAARLTGSSFEATPISNLPAWMNRANLLMDYAPKKELAAFDGTRVTLGQKAVYLKKYPLGPIDSRIERPPSAISTPNQRS